MSGAMLPTPLRSHGLNRWSAFETWWHTRRNQISSFAETDESI